MSNELKVKQQRYCRANALANGNQQSQRGVTSPIKKVTIVSAKSEELVGGAPSERNWRGILIALLVIAAVLGLIACSIALVSPAGALGGGAGGPGRGRRPTLAETLQLDALAAAVRFNGTWLYESQIAFRDEHGGVSLMDVDNGTTKVLLHNATFFQFNAVDYRISTNANLVLLVSDVVHVHAHTRLARYHVYEINTRARTALSPAGDVGDAAAAPLLQHAEWNPDSHGVAFVHDYDVYYKPQALNAKVCRFTRNSDVNKAGRAPHIISGTPDWLYEHEVFRSRHAMWFSPDGKYLAFLTLNETQVGVHRYAWYGVAGGEPGVREMRYPRLGTANPVPSLHVAILGQECLKKPKVVDVKFPQAVIDAKVDSFYITSVSWAGPRQLGVVWLNRPQNESIVTLCRLDADNWVCEIQHIERAPPHIGWVTPTLRPLWSPRGSSLHLIPVQEAAADGDAFMHVCQLTPIAAGQTDVTPLSRGKFEVERLLSWDEESHVVWVIAAPEGRPGERHVYRVGDVNGTQSWVCVTCPPDTNNTNEEYVEEPACLYMKATVSPGWRYMVQECLGPAPPWVRILDAVTGAHIADLLPGTQLRRRLRPLARPQLRTLNVEVEDGYVAPVRLILPAALRGAALGAGGPPLVLLLDTRPGEQAVTERWSAGWAWYLAANRSLAVARVDPRGAAGGGERSRADVRHNLGQADAQDLLAVLGYLARGGGACVVGGPGYGGYAALAMLAADARRLINCTAALAPISLWPMYNSYFTERYLGTSAVDAAHAALADRGSGRAAALATRSSVPGSLLIAHGAADADVHLAHSMALAARLAHHGALFSHLVYPDEGHSLSGVRRHLYAQLDAHLGAALLDPRSGLDPWDADPHDDTADLFGSLRQ